MAAFTHRLHGRNVKVSLRRSGDGMRSMAIYATSGLGIAAGLGSNGLPARQETVKVIVETSICLDVGVAFRTRSIVELVGRDGRAMVMPADVRYQILTSLG